MAIIRIDVPDTEINDWRDCFSEDYRALLEDGTNNPQTRLQYAKVQMLRVLIGKVLAHKRRKVNEAIADATSAASIT